MLKWKTPINYQGVFVLRGPGRAGRFVFELPFLVCVLQESKCRYGYQGL